MISSKHIMKSLQRQPKTRTNRNKSPAFTTRSSHLQILSQNYQINYSDLSKQALINLLTKSNHTLEQYKSKYQNIYLESDSLKAEIVQSNDKITHLIMQVQKLRVQNEQIKKYSQLLKQKYQNQIQGLELNTKIYEESFQNQKNQEIRIREEMYKEKLQKIVLQFQNYKNSRERQSGQQNYRRLLQIQMDKFQLLQDNYNQVCEQIEHTKQQYVAKSMQLQTQISNSDKLMDEIEILKQTNQVLRGQLISSVEKMSQRKCGQLQKLNQILKSSYEKKINLLDQNLKQQKTKSDKQRAYYKKQKQQKRLLKIRNQQLEMKIKMTESKCFQATFQLANLKKECFAFERQFKLKQLEMIETSNTARCYSERQTKVKNSKAQQCKIYLKGLVRQIKQLKIKLSQMKQQVKFSLQIDKQRIRSYLKQCETMILVNMNLIKNEGKIRMVDDEKRMNHQTLSQTKQFDSYKKSNLQNQILSLNSQMKRLKKDMNIMSNNQVQNYKQIQQLKRKIEHNKIDKQNVDYYHKRKASMGNQRPRINYETGHKDNKIFTENRYETQNNYEDNGSKTFKTNSNSYQDRKKSISAFNSGYQGKISKSNRLLNDIYEQIDHQQEAISHNQIKLKHYKNASVNH